MLSINHHLQQNKIVLSEVAAVVVQRPFLPLFATSYNIGQNKWNI